MEGLSGEAGAALALSPKRGTVSARGRGLRCVAKSGGSFRGPPTGLAVGFGLRKAALRSVRARRARTDRFTPRSWVPGSGGRRTQRRRPVTARSPPRGADRLIRHGSQLRGSVGTLVFELSAIIS